MQLMVCSALSAWCRDPEHGVNAAIQAMRDDDVGAVPRWSGHPAPPLLEVIASPFDEGDGTAAGQLLSRDADRVAKWEHPRAYPALVWVPDGPVEVDAEVATFHRDANKVAVSARYLVRNSNQPRTSSRDAAYTMAALHRCLKGFFADDAIGRAARRGAGKMIIQAQYAAYGPWQELVGEALAVAVFALTVHVRNSEP